MSTFLLSRSEKKSAKKFSSIGFIAYDDDDELDDTASFTDHISESDYDHEYDHIVERQVEALKGEVNKIRAEYDMLQALMDSRQKQYLVAISNIRILNKTIVDLRQQIVRSEEVNVSLREQLEQCHAESGYCAMKYTDPPICSQKPTDEGLIVEAKNRTDGQWTKVPDSEYALQVIALQEKISDLRRALLTAQSTATEQRQAADFQRLLAEKLSAENIHLSKVHDTVLEENRKQRDALKASALEAESLQDTIASLTSKLQEAMSQQKERTVVSRLTASTALIEAITTELSGQDEAIARLQDIVMRRRKSVAQLEDSLRGEDSVSIGSASASEGGTKNMPSTKRGSHVVSGKSPQVSMTSKSPNSERRSHLNSNKTRRLALYH
jgi:hypothetical protein